jgi:hypothetical protein
VPVSPGVIDTLRAQLDALGVLEKASILQN